MKEFINKLDDLSPFPYYINHLLVATLIGIITLSPIAGGMFYAGREVRDAQKAGYWDTKGFNYPFWPMLIADIAFKAWIIITFILPMLN